jgi:hypothetical protein
MLVAGSIEGELVRKLVVPVEKHPPRISRILQHRDAVCLEVASSRHLHITDLMCTHDRENMRFDIPPGVLILVSNHRCDYD